MKNLFAWILSTSAIIGTTTELVCRSIFRPHGEEIPHLAVRWVPQEDQSDDDIDDQVYHLYHANLEANAVFEQFDKKYLMARALPDTQILARDGVTQVPGIIIKIHLDEVTHEIQDSVVQKKEYANWKVLKNSNFNAITHAGVIVLKHKQYPIVVKLFMETPSTFVNPFSKGFEPSFFFLMGGGASRFLSGFNRIKNAEKVTKIVAESDLWRDKIAIPKKWFWTPLDAPWFEVRGDYMAPQQLVTQFPSVYAVVCQAITAKRTFEITNQQERRTAIQLFHLFKNRIDPHIDNFMWEEGTGKIVIIDTEFFPYIVGFRRPLGPDEVKNYAGWYKGLAIKCLHDGFFRTKQERMLLRNYGYGAIMSCSAA